MLTKRGEALRRLGGAVCRVCDGVGEEVVVRWVSQEGHTWLRGKGLESLVQQSLAPMCGKCFLLMENQVVAARAAAAERRAAELAREVDDDARLGSLSGPLYRAACAEHQDDLESIEEISNGWIGNGLFGGSGEE